MVGSGNCGPFNIGEELSTILFSSPFASMSRVELWKDGRVSKDGRFSYEGRVSKLGLATPENDGLGLFLLLIGREKLILC